MHSLTPETVRFTCKIKEMDFSNVPFQRVDPEVFSTMQVSHLIIGFSEWNQYSHQAYQDLFKGIALSFVDSLDFGFPIKYEFTILPGFFDPLSVSRLSNLTLQGNSLRLKPFVFSGLTNLKHITIMYTDIEDIYPEYFEGMSGLRGLDLHLNKIVHFNPNLSAWNVSLLHLNLSRNNIFGLSMGVFNGLDKLMMLDLSDNPCRYVQGPSPLLMLQYLDVSRTAFFSYDVSLPNLRTFSFSGRINQGQSFLEPSRFRDSLLLERIILDNSRVDLKQLWTMSLNSSIFQGLHSLTSIDLSNNDLSILPHGLFPYLPLLLELNLGHCKISIIEPGAFMGLRSLKRLYLDHNRLSKLTPDVFKIKMGDLYLLCLNSNLLEYLDEDVFVNTPAITNLTISNNQFTILNRSTFSLIPNLKFIDVSENPFQCSCKIKWLIDWRKSSLHIARANETVCSFTSDPPFRGKLIFAIDPEVLCASHVNLYFILPLVAVVLTGILLAVYFKRWVVKYKMFLFKLAIFGYEEIQDPRDHGSYEFDMYIIFTSDDQQWASEYLLPRVKESLPHFNRIAFGDETLPLGMYYLDAVLYVIVLRLSSYSVGPPHVTRNL